LFHAFIDQIKIIKITISFSEITIVKIAIKKRRPENVALKLQYKVSKFKTLE